MWISDSHEVSFGCVNSACCIPFSDDAFPVRALILAFASPQEPFTIPIFRTAYHYLRGVFCNLPHYVSDLLKLCASRLIELALARMAINDDSKVCVLA